MSAQAQTQNLNIWKIAFKALKVLLIILSVCILLDLFNIPMFDGFILGILNTLKAIFKFIVIDLGIGLLKGLFGFISNGV